MLLVVNPSGRSQWVQAILGYLRQSICPGKLGRKKIEQVLYVGESRSKWICLDIGHRVPLNPLLHHLLLQITIICVLVRHFHTHLNGKRCWRLNNCINSWVTVANSLKSAQLKIFYSQKQTWNRSKKTHFPNSFAMCQNFGGEHQHCS